MQLYLGLIMVDSTAYVGYRLRGVPGALLATLGFSLVALASHVRPLCSLSNRNH